MPKKEPERDADIRCTHCAIAWIGMSYDGGKSRWIEGEYYPSGGEINSLALAIEDTVQAWLRENGFENREDELKEFSVEPNDAPSL